MKEKFVRVEPHNTNCPWLADLESSLLKRSGCSGRALMRVCPQGNGEVRLIVAVNSHTPMGQSGAPNGEPRIVADMTQEEAFSLGMALVRASMGKEPPHELG